LIDWLRQRAAKHERRQDGTEDDVSASKDRKVRSDGKIGDTHAITLGQPPEAENASRSLENSESRQRLRPQRNK
jgi:hypothetical protein